ncbi:Extradiol ring-cleavage dioxygenase, class III enzyme, subunit B [Lipomyces mesembrius]
MTVTNETKVPVAPAICVSHGGGPMPILGEPGHKNMVKSWETRVRKLLKVGTPEAPKAIILVTAHWSTQRPTISSGAKHELYYDYYNFPPETYKIKYDAPGSPSIAKDIYTRLQKVGFSPKLDETRGWDHGVFIPMKLIVPDESIPIVQMSVLESEDPEEHYRIGQVLSELRKENIAILGSGFATFHNLRLFPRSSNFPPDIASKLREWSGVLNEAVLTKDVDERLAKLKRWREFPHAYTMHPQHGAEHFLPLIVTAGAGGSSKGALYGDEFLGADMFSFYWE